MKKLIETHKCFIELLDSGIVRVETKAGASIEQIDLDDNYRVFVEELKIERALFLIVFGKDGLVDAASMQRFANPDRNQMKIAEALVVHSVEHALEANFFLKKFPLQHPIKVFDLEEDAIMWLKLQLI